LSSAPDVTRGTCSYDHAVIETDGAAVSVKHDAIATHDVRGGGGLRLHVTEWGKPDGPAVLFVHGWSQSQLCWARQLHSTRLQRLRMVTFDIRGHGMSEKPTDPEHYGDEQLWADDVAAVIEHLALHRPVLVGWSYGGFVIADYLRAYGEAGVAGIVLAGGAVLLNSTFDHIGPGFLENAPDACSPDLDTNTAAVLRFLRACTAEPLDDDDWSKALAWNMVVPPEVRGALISRQIDADDVLVSLSVPVLVAHGRADTIVLPSMAEHVLAVCPSAEASWYEAVGHLPFWEDAERFNRELDEFVTRVG
jgi:non-heme chloroperoxidase